MQLCQLFKIKSTKHINGKSALLLKKEKVNHTRNNLVHTPTACSVVKGVVIKQVDPLYVNSCAADVDSVETDSTVLTSDIEKFESDLNELSAEKEVDNDKPLAEVGDKNNVSSELVAESEPPKPKRLRIILPKPTVISLNPLKPTCLNPLLSKSFQPVPLKAKPLQVKAKKPEPKPDGPEPKLPPGPKYPAVFKDKPSTFRTRCGHDQVGINIFHNFRGACLSCEEDISTLDLALEHVKHLLPKFSSFLAEERLMYNSKRRAMESAFNCPVCTKAQLGENKDLALLIHMKRHIIAIHEEKKNCQDCLTNYDSILEYIQHLPECRRRRECQHCGKRVVNLGTHQAECLRKKNDGEWKCKDCGFASKSINKYYAHRQEEHVQYSRSCEKCGKEFRNSYAWRSHSCENGSSALVFSCDQCDFKCSKSNSLKSHVEMVHTNYSQTCEECGKTFNNSQAWNNHSHNVENSKDRNFVCDLCGKSFSRYWALEGHKKSMHEQMYHYQCSHCKRKFKNAIYAKYHSVLHSDLNPFECSTCGLRFNRPSAAGKHRKEIHPNSVMVHVQKEEVKKLAKKLIINIKPEQIKERQKGARYKNMTKVSLESMDDEDPLAGTGPEGMESHGT